MAPNLLFMASFSAAISSCCFCNFWSRFFSNLENSCSKRSGTSTGVVGWKSSSSIPLLTPGYAWRRSVSALLDEKITKLMELMLTNMLYCFLQRFVITTLYSTSECFYSRITTLLFKYSRSPTKRPVDQYIDFRGSIFSRYTNFMPA